MRACALARTLGPVHLAVYDALSPVAPNLRSALPSLPTSSRGVAGQLPASYVCVVAMPQLSTTMTHGIVRKWAKGEGEPLEQYDLLFDLDTDSLTEDAYKVGDFEGRLLAMGAWCQSQLLPCAWRERTLLPVHTCMPIVGTSKSLSWGKHQWQLHCTLFCCSDQPPLPQAASP